MSQNQTRPLSVKEMRKHIENGQSVSFGGRIIRDVRDLPTEAEAATDTTGVQLAIDDLKRQRDELDRQIGDAEGRLKTVAQQRQANDSRATQVAVDPNHPTTMAGGPALVVGGGATRGEQDFQRERAARQGVPAVGGEEPAAEVGDRHAGQSTDTRTRGKRDKKAERARAKEKAAAEAQQADDASGGESAE